MTTKEVKATEERNKEVPPCNILIDEEGYWYYEGNRIIREDFVKMFYEHLDITDEGIYVIRLHGDVCRLEVKDTAFVVWGVEVLEDSKIILKLSDWSEELIVPNSLWIAPNNVMYCKVKNGRFPCRFTRKAFYQITQLLEEKEGKFYLRLGERLYPLVYEPR